MNEGLKKNNEKQCKGCGKLKKLIKAHIYPQWMVKKQYPNGVINSKESLILISGINKFTKKRRIGVYDTTILCGECDSFLGKNFDEKAKDILVKLPHRVLLSIQEGQIFSIEGADAVVLKNFILSIVLRAAWSQQEDCVNFTLPDKYLNELRNIVFNNTESSDEYLAVFITQFKESNISNAEKKYFHAPYNTRFGDGINFTIITLPDGYKAFIKFDQRNTPKELSKLTLCKNREVLILKWETFQESKEYKWLIPYIKGMDLEVKSSSEFPP